MALPTASDNPFPSVLVTETAAASIGSPAAGKQRLFVDTDHVLKYKNSSGTVSSIGGGGGAVASDAIWDTKGDLAVASAADTAAKLAVGSNGQVLTADSAQTLGVKWAAAGGGGVTVDSYVENTTSPAFNATTAATAGTVVTAAAVTCDGTSVYCIEFFCYDVSIPGGSGKFAIFELYDGSTQLGRFLSMGNGGASVQFDMPVFGRRFLTPSAASHTFSIRGWTAASTTITCNSGSGGSGGLPPLYIRVTHGG